MTSIKSSKTHSFLMNSSLNDGYVIGHRSNKNKLCQTLPGFSIGKRNFVVKC